MMLIENINVFFLIKFNISNICFVPLLFKTANIALEKKSVGRAI